MARRKRESGGGGGNAPWLNTFADLMNLLLCFFVMLFAMSNVDAEKFEDISISFSNAFGVLDGGGTAIGEGQLISSGMTQLNNLDDFFSNMGEKSKQTGDLTKDKDSSSGTESGDKSDTSEASYEEIKDAQEKIMSEMEDLSEAMYDKVSEFTEKYNLADYVELSIDDKYQYVQLSLKGSILFDSGKADIITDAKPILSKIGNVLDKFEGFTIEIIGHTDNVPMNKGTFKDNNWLSSARALNAAEFLIKNNELDPEKLKYSGRGEYEPIASNDTSEGRQKNRRIEIRIFNELSNR
ncbi:MAG TPA: flagellar motor protein MotB [Mobilitalea sp.]|nr:flagellar motor protein MotB [Mobilitalea sp.]